MTLISKKSMGIALMAVSILAVTACKKENVEKDVAENTENRYPAEVTMDNWQEFVNAPLDVIEQLEKKEMENHKLKPLDRDVPAELTSGDRAWTLGYVQAYGGGWAPFGGVAVSTTSGCATTTVAYSPYNYLVSCTTGSMCMSYSTAADNGVTTFDLVKISRHILGITPFTEARQFLAADANRDGAITSADIDDIRAVILHTATSFPNSDNVIFVIDEDYTDGQAEIDATGTWTWYGVIGANACYATYNKDRRGIKTGDVSGNFSF